MSHRISEVKHINKTIRDTVFGYVRECESLFNPSSTIETIPLIISNICALFYHQKETFSRSQNTIAHSTCVEPKLIFQDKLCYGSISIQPQKYPDAIFQWKVKLLAVNDRIRIGISTIFRTCYYALESTGKLYQKHHSHTAAIANGKWGCYYSPQLNTNDIVTIELDVKHQTIRYHVNNINMGVAFRNVDISQMYNFGVSLRRNDKIELLHFQQMIVNKEMENIDYDPHIERQLFRFNIDISEHIIELLRAHTMADCDHKTEEKIRSTVDKNEMNAKRLLSMGRKGFVAMLKDEANVKLGYGCKVFKYITKYILNN